MAAMKVLVVESDPVAVKTIADTIGTHLGYAALVVITQSATALIETARRADRKYDAMVINTDIKGSKGLELVRAMRTVGDLTPVLMVGDQFSREDLVTCLDAGADDYMVKPLDPLELAARLRAIARRMQLMEPVATKVGNLMYDKEKMLFFVDKKPVFMSPRASVVLEALFKRSGSVLSRDFLCALTPEMISIEALNIRISRLRKLLRDAKCTATIKSHHAVGYELAEGPAADQQ